MAAVLEEFWRLYKSQRRFDEQWARIRPGIRTAIDLGFKTNQIGRYGELVNSEDADDVRFTLFGRSAFIGWRNDREWAYIVCGAVIATADGERLVPVKSLKLTAAGTVDGSEVQLPTEDIIEPTYLELILDSAPGIIKAHFDQSCPLP